MKRNLREPTDGTTAEFTVDVFSLANMVFHFFSLNLKAFRCGVFSVPLFPPLPVTKYTTASVIYVVAQS